jgi:hypothetical protein
VYLVWILGEESDSENQLTHELDNMVMWQHGNTYRKTTRISQTIGMSLSSRVNLALQGKQCGLESFGTNLTL